VSLDEEPLDRFLNRPLARWAARILKPTPITANQVSAFAGLLGVLAGMAMGLGTPAALILAAILLWGQLVFDCADGELARLRGGGGWTGQVVDGLFDYVVAIAIHVGLWVLMAKTPGWRHEPWYVIGSVVALAGFSMALHSALFDAAKQSFRAKLGKSTGWSEDPERLREKVRQGGSLLERLLLPFYGSYTHSQRRFAAWVGPNGAPTQGSFLVWSVLGPTFRVSLLVLVLVACLWSPRAIGLYPLFGGVIANLFLVLLVVGARRRRNSMPAET